MGWAGHIAHMRRQKIQIKFWLVSLKRRDQSEDLSVDGRIILKWNLGKQVLRAWIGFIWFRIGTCGGLL
jgi:hypothetical protein